jgi:hypothetical protein
MQGSRVFNDLDAGLRRHDELIRISLNAYVELIGGTHLHM